MAAVAGVVSLGVVSLVMAVAWGVLMEAEVRAVGVSKGNTMTNTHHRLPPTNYCTETSFALILYAKGSVIH